METLTPGIKESSKGVSGFNSAGLGPGDELGQVHPAVRRSSWVASVFRGRVFPGETLAENDKSHLPG